MDISTTPPVAGKPLAGPPLTQRLAAPAPPIELIDVSSHTLLFEDFYRQSAQTVARALAATLNDAELAADATNEAMTRAFERWAKISTYDKPEAWVYRVGLNWSLSWRRRRRREQDRPIKFTPDEAELGLRDSSFDGALAELSMDHRAVVICRIHLDWSVQQTAKALGIAPGTVQSRLARAIANLRKNIEGADA